jgi:DNA-3-methyladenine glycosylase II
MDTDTLTRHRIPVTGPFDLAKIATMEFGHRDERSFDGVLRMAFCVDGDYQSQVGVAVRQDAADLDVSIVEPPGGPPVDPSRVLSQVARVVSADHDGEQYARICRADPVLKSIWSRAPGFRPALFYSPYEAAVWSVISARRARAQGIRLS